MKSLSSLLLLAFWAAPFFAESSHAKSQNPSPERGTTLSLSITKPYAGEGQLSATVTLFNLSKTDIDFEFQGDPKQHFTFCVRDPAGNIVWNSDDDYLPSGVMSPATLHSRSSWRQQIIVPLSLALPKGRYVLEARTIGSPEFSAKATFDLLRSIFLSGEEAFYEGTLATAMALGGVMDFDRENTWVFLETTNCGTYKLDFGGNRDLERDSQLFNSKRVGVVGVLAPYMGVEVKKPRILKVASLNGTGVEMFYQGILYTNRIGIETTGAILETADRGTYELKFGGNTALQQAADKFDHKNVVVVGVFEPRAGTEVKYHRFIEVKSLMERR